MQADKIISDSHLDKEYSAIHGDAEFCKLVAQLAFGESSSIVKDGLVNCATTASTTYVLWYCEKTENAYIYSVM